jgi:agmatine deiminase
MNWRMPPETAPQERVWMAFPPAGSTITATDEATDEARRAWTRVAHAVADYEPVTMVVDPADRDTARGMLSGDIDLVETPLDDAWMRDIGPSFVLDDEGRLGAVDWVFNGWGQQEWARWDHDSQVGRAVAAAAGCEVVASPLVNEGGAFHLDGLGTVLLTDTVQLDPYRNPNLDKAAVEAELARTIGTTHAVWLPRGLARDAEALGTRGHVDMVATIPSAGRLLVHAQGDAAHPDHAIMKGLVDGLRETHDAEGRAWDIIEVPAPTVVRDDEGWVDYSYINHLVINGAVIGCGFGDPNDAQARSLLSDAYPGREVIMVESRPIFARGGGIHCITQQQPKAR